MWLGSFSILFPRPQGYLSVLHLKAVAYVSLDNAVLGELGQCHHLAPQAHPGPWAHPFLSLVCLPSPLFQGTTSFMPRPAHC